MKWIPSLPEIAREAIIVAAGALVAAIVIKSLPPQAQELFTFNKGA